MATALKTRLEVDGLGLQSVGRVGDYNAVTPGAYALPELGSPDHAVIVIGHGREVWAPFVRALRADPALRRGADPFDRWTSVRIEAAVRALVPGTIPHVLRFVWEAPPRMVAMQKLAVSTGLATLGPAGLTIDPVRGPWIAFRAALVLAIPIISETPVQLSPCSTCREKPCVAALDLAQGGSVAASPHARVVQPQWRLWLGVRDACPVGRAARYSDAQIRYHYARDLRALDEEA